MKKMIIGLLMLISITAWAEYSVGETLSSSDNLSWTINGPSGNSEVGKTSTIFAKISEGKAVFLFQGQSW